jgi:hypothetical protein
LIFNKKLLKIIGKLFGILMSFYYLYYVLKIKDMSLPFNLNSVLATASLVEGFDVVRNAFPVEGRFTKRVITYADAVYEALNDVAEDYSDWPEDQGFGSSDMTYVRKSFIDSMISLANLRGYYQTDFKPYLKVVEYSEIDKEEYDLRREQGI